ncbi:hypothetical protein AWB81_06513 [Caballeronia arationis]|uniref:hypothetical protein n=1 Tax=Caballeronia arationis TaxID=1777142 RepID=UPI00074CBAAE|nr:hypothetical protein [Caballeronia arationis]SAL03824.1 hypothetical protein AWB81_06513 [Caballeronia arationis]
MFRSYLIDPLSCTVTKVREGFDRAGQLLGTDRLDVATLWTASFDPHSSVNLVSADEATLDEPMSETGFSLFFTCHGTRKDWQVTGKAVFVAGGDIPTDIAEQVDTVASVERAVEFKLQMEAAVVAWTEHSQFSNGRADVRRAQVKNERSDNRKSGS